MRRLLLILAALAGLTACEGGSSLDRATRSKLEELDRYIASREIYYARKNGRLESLRSIIGTTKSPEALYDLQMNMAREFFSYSLDSTQHYLKSCQSIALDQLKDKDRYNAATIMLGHLYGKGGNYLEASQILYGQIDSASLSPALKAEYYWVLYDFCGDMAGNSGIVESLSIPPASAYLPVLFRLLPKDSPRWRIALRNKYIEEGNLDSADSVSALLLAGVKPEDRDYAIHAYFQSEIEYRRGNHPERMSWLIQSAECDLVNAVRDYASLTMVAQIILPNDVDRSFRYLISKETSCSPLQYQLGVRLARAKNLLKSSDMPISEIAETLGFNSTWYFSHFFKKHTKMSAAAYRNNKSIAPKAT